MRRYFLDRVVMWRWKRPELFFKLQDQLFPQRASSPEQLSDEQFLQLLDERFSFAAYCALNVERGVRDSIEVHVQTWAFITFIFIIAALLARRSNVTLTALTPVLFALSMLVFLLMFALAHRGRMRIRKHEGIQPAPSGG